MCVELKPLDNFKLRENLCTNFACGYSEDDRLFILTDLGVHIVSLKGYISSPFLSFCCKKEFFKISNYTSSANINLDINSFHAYLNRKDLYEATLAREYSAQLNYAKPFNQIPLCAEWSPRGIVGKTDCILAVLTSLYSLEMYVKYIDQSEVMEYCEICNVTGNIIERQKPQWKYIDKFPPSMKLKEMKKRIEFVNPTGFTWSHLYIINGNECCAIFVGHTNGEISAWQINLRPLNSKEKSQLYFLGRYSTHLKRITTLHWHQTDEYGGGLSFADEEGRMSLLNVSNLNHETVTMDSELAFWTESDKVLVDKITVIVHDDNTYILLIKQSFLIIYGITKSGKVFDQNVCQVENYYITGLYHFKNVIIVLTLPGVLKEFTLSVVNDRISLKEKILPLKIDTTLYRTHGFFFTKNMILFGVLAQPCRMHLFRQSRTFINVFLFNNSLLNPLDILWYNKSGSLRDYWDCFEVLRLLCLKEKRFPWLGLPADLNYDNLTLLQLKTLRLLAKLSEMVFSTVPVIKSYNIKPYILLHYLVEIKLIIKRLNKLFNLQKSGKELTVFQMRSIDIQNFFLKEMVVKNILPKANVGKKFVNDISHVMSIANEMSYPSMMQCIWCGEKIIGPLCLPPHADCRCSISMMPILLVPSYKCPFCKVLAHEEIESEQSVIFCPYCDIPMEKRFVDKKALEDFSDCSNSDKGDYKVNCDNVQSACYEDCCKDGINFSDIEENKNEFVIFSDSDDETSEEQSKLRMLDLQLGKMSLEDILKFETKEISDSSAVGVSRKRKLDD